MSADLKAGDDTAVASAAGEAPGAAAKIEEPELSAKGDDAGAPPLPIVPHAPAPPQPTTFEPDDRRAVLVANIENALRAVPGYFTSDTNIEGIGVGDLFSLNSVLGGAIEIQVVNTLNKLRTVWDPESEWVDCRFERRSQSFPDVRLTRRRSGVFENVMGIELKGWYVFSKEMVPSFRYKVTPDACSPYDLLVIVPWYLQNILSGSPIVMQPYIAGARFVAEYRNYWWEFVRNEDDAGTAKKKSAKKKSSSTQSAPRGVKKPAGIVEPYPAPKTKTNDAAESDTGLNFGRIARTGQLTNAFLNTVLTESIAGIEARSWIAFFQSFKDTSDPEIVWNKLEARLKKQIAARSDEKSKRIGELLKELAVLLKR